MKATEKLIEVKINRELMAELSAKAIINIIKFTKIISYMMLVIAGIILLIGTFLEVPEFCKFSLTTMTICGAWLGIVTTGKAILKRI